MNTLDFKQLFEQSSIGQVVIDTDFTIVAVSDTFLQATKTTRKNIIGKNAFIVFPDNPQDKDANGESTMRTSFNKVIATKATDTLAIVKYDIPLPQAEGGGFETRYWRPTHIPVLDAFNNVKYIIQQTENVTENKLLIEQLYTEKKMLKQMEDSEKRYNMMLMKSPFGFAVLKGRNMVITLANDSIKTFWGKGKDLEGKPLFVVIPELKNSEFPDLIDNVYTTGIPFHGEDLLAPIFRNGKHEEVYFNFVYQPYLEADESISGVTIIAYEVTAQVVVKKALEAQHEAEKKALKLVEETNTRYYTMLMQSPFAFSIMKGKDMVITLANDLIKEFWGKGMDVEGKTLLQLLPELKDQPFPEMINQVFTTGNPIYAKEILAQLQYNDKREDKYFNIVYQPHYEADNSISGVITMAYEVTELVLARKKAEKSETRLRSIVMQAPVAIGIYKGKEYIAEIANEHCLQMLSKGVDFVGQPLFDILPELETQGFKALMDNVMERGTTYYGNELAFNIHKNNISTQGFYNFIIQQLRADDESVTGIVVVASEVTEQVLARQKVEESEFRFHNLVYTSPSMIAIFKGEDMIIEIANDSIIESWGKGKDIIGKSLLSIMPEIIEQGFDKILSEVYKTGIPFHAYEEPVSLLRNGKLEVLHYTYVYQAQRNINGEIEGVAVIANEVTPQATLNLKIRESEGRFRLLVQQAPVAICVIRGEKYVVETVNAGMLEFWGRTEAQVLHKPIFEVLTELENQGFEALVHGVYTTGQKFVGTELPVTLLRKGQLENAYVTFVYEPLREVDGTISGIMVLAHEITDLVVARKKIEAQVIMHEDMLMNAPYVICTLEGPDHVYSFVNEQYQQLFGSRILTGKPFLKAIPEFEGQGFDTILDKIYNTGETYVGNDIPATFTREEGHTSELRYFNFSYQPMFDENRKIYSILGFGYEVTETVNARKRIEVSENKFRLLTNNMPQKITNADAEGNVIFFNQQWLDDTGLMFEELRDWGWKKAMHPDDLELTVNNWKHSVATGDVFDMELRIQNKEGDYRWHLSRAVPVRDENGKIITWVGSNTDIHEQKEQKEVLEKAVKSRTKELEIMNLELENANKDLTSFTYVSSHDLQEPLRKIQNFASMILLEEEENLSETGKGYFLRMTQTAKRMQALIEDLLTYSRAKNSERIIETVNLNMLLNEVRVDFEELIQQKNATIEADLCDARVIPFQFRQLMQNLISNSLKFSKPDLPPHIIIKGKIATEKELRESCQLESQGKLIDQEKYCHIIFTDNGIGFEPEYKERIFEVFQRLHSVEEYAGTGIGLAICRRIIENHHGIITATGKLNEGAQFEIYIPA